MNIKQQLYNECKKFLDARLEVIQNTISDIQKSLQSETKSSAGDKHETGRAMLQLEREKAGQQLAELQKLAEILQKINIESKHQSVALGSVVKTSVSNYFISISAGEIECDGECFYAVSPSTPIGKLLLSKTERDEVVFMQQKFTILNIF